MSRLRGGYRYAVVFSTPAASDGDANPRAVLRSALADAVNVVPSITPVEVAFFLAWLRF
jgi:hypothetical protein